MLGSADGWAAMRDWTVSGILLKRLPSSRSVELPSLSESLAAAAGGGRKTTARGLLAPPATSRSGSESDDEASRKGILRDE